MTNVPEDPIFRVVSRSKIFRNVTVNVDGGAWTCARRPGGSVDGTVYPQHPDYRSYGAGERQRNGDCDCASEDRPCSEAGRQLQSNEQHVQPENRPALASRLENGS